MNYLLDTVTLVRHFTGNGIIGQKALEIMNNIDNSDDVFFISIISLMEVMYLAEKKRIEINLSETLEIIDQFSNYIIVDLNSDILTVAESIVFYELHDRLILATSKWLGIKIISSDTAFSSVNGIEVVWD